VMNNLNLSLFFFINMIGALIGENIQVLLDPDR
jgi:hypothetical protein